MERLVQGYLRFNADVFPKQKHLFERLAGEQNPLALIVTCADSRVLPNLITQSGPGDLFLCRNAGNIIPSYGTLQGGVSATIEYAVLVLGVRDIIVCGHSDCGAMRAVMHPEKLVNMPTVQGWLGHAELARRVVEESYPEMTPEQTLDALIRENVLAQLDHLKTHPSVASKLKLGELGLHGWVYGIDTGLIEAYDAEAHAFRPLALDDIPVATPPRRRPLFPHADPYQPQEKKAEEARLYQEVFAQED